ncbi:NADP-binding protein [Dacryopinax primogenitus]|uniref:D-xylose 1-dehydrogenase (NADP(+), D-xylono-1,5-lactone-forming) n=1 Tax=Dacryopinax primogenitus (strain DJM 731) TaxID=1858805 RepID=M5FZ52_DACPD|nr:NADP-binding protein [Dacryopinax primogenitus]EJU03321.1 NADP-binding protein [Dacryopinax primogenitus]
MTTPFNLKWGILATGRISHIFTKDILMPPSTRQVTDVSHTFVAVASSSSIDKAHQFIKDFEADLKVAQYQTTGAVRPYGSYADLLADKDVEVVYVGSPHSDHYKTCLAALRAGKHILCEKAFTLNAAQTEHLCALAKEKKLFLMEAQWTRFFPSILDLQTQLNSPQMPFGRIYRTFADFSIQAPASAAHRLYDPKQGGGALLDLGVYPILWCFILFYRNPENTLTPPSVTASVVNSPLTGVDEQDTVVLKWDKLGFQSTCCTSLVGRTEEWALILYGEKGNVYIPHPLSRPSSYTVHMHGEAHVKHQIHIPGQGMHWEADAVARSISKGELENPIMPHQESIEIMKVMDKVRKIGNVSYGELEDLEK